ncbi:hypothetical protein [Enterobacter ludwigii]
MSRTAPQGGEQHDSDKAGGHQSQLQHRDVAEQGQLYHLFF